MTMPINLVLVRHGESEGNVANKLSRAGDHSAFSEEFKKRHSSFWRLSERGRQQAIAAGEWIRENIKDRFDRYYVSEYLRAMETAALLGLENAVWYRDFFLRERGWGHLEVISQEERLFRFEEEMWRYDRDGFFWTPPGGESMADVCVRLHWILNTLHRECSDKSVVIVCHGEVMWNFRVRLERLTQQKFCELENSKNPYDKIYNCQILHYTRRDPDTGALAENLNWFRSVCPTDLSLSSNIWQEIERPRFTNEDLLRDTEKIPRLVHGVK